MVTLALAVSISPASAQAAGEYELNDSRDSAYGPLAGGTDYTATLETDNDVDWYVFYIKTYSQVDFSATKIKGTWVCGADISILDKDGEYVSYLEVGAINSVSHRYLTMSPGRYYLEVDDCQQEQYRFRIDPASALTTSRDCGEAIVARESGIPQLSAVDAELAKVAPTLAARTQAVDEAAKVVRQTAGRSERLLRKAKGLAKRGKKLRRQLKRLSRAGKAKRAKLRKVRRKLRKSRLKLDRRRDQLSDAQSDARDATEKLGRAEADRQPVSDQKAKLETLANQHKQEIANAEGQIAAHC